MKAFKAKELIIESKTHGRFVILYDSVDEEKVNKHTWHIVKAHNGQFYVNTHVPHPDGGYEKNRPGTKRKTLLQFHRYILNAPKGKVVDHINGNPLDNRKKNLRLVTHRQNSQNQAKARTWRGKSTTSQYRGVTKRDENRYRSKPWMARVTVNGKGKHIGYYATEEEAAKAWDEHALKTWGEYARLNFPE